MNWIQRRGKSVIFEAVITGEIVESILKTFVFGLVELNTIKNLTDSFIVGSLGGFNTHVVNSVSTTFLYNFVLGPAQ